MMMWGPTALMTVIDVAILSITVLSLLTVLRQRAKLSAAKAVFAGAGL